MFGSWQSFYQMTGEVAATLVGLLFIVVTLTSGRVTPTTMRGMKLFTTPTVLHLVSVIVISALALVPDGEGGSRAAVMSGWAVLAAGYMVTLAVQIHRIPDPADGSDTWWYGMAPAATYLALAVATASAWLQLPHAPYFIALCLIVLLLVTVRNAWDLITWLAPRRDNT
jgi:hypothetical protein